MKKYILALTLWMTFAIVGYVQCASIGLTLISEVDNNPNGVPVYKIIFPNGTTSISDAVLTYTAGAASLTANQVNDTHIDWGSGANQVDAADILITDVGDKITGTNVDTALTENRTAIDLNTAKVTYNAEIPQPPTIETTTAHTINIDTELGKTWEADNAGDVTFTLPNGDENGQVISFSKIDTGDCIISGAIYDGGTSGTQLKGTVLESEVQLKWSSTASKWRTISGTGTWTVSTP